MGIKDFFSLFTDEEAFCDKYRQLIENLYKQARKTEDPSTAIALIYYKSIKAMGWQVTENDADYQAHRLSNLAEPENIKALSLSLLLLEHPNLVVKFPKFAQELDRLALSLATKEE